MKTVLITGANKGIGYETARQLKDLGWRVILSSRDAEKGRAAATSLACDYMQMDVSDEESILMASVELSCHTRQLDALINNAGIYSTEGMDFQSYVVRNAFETNALGPLLTTRAFTLLLEQSGNAQVVNVSTGMSQSSHRTEGAIAYRISKTALNAVTRITSNELFDNNIRVNAVCPGWVRTDMGGPDATRDVAQGAETIVWLATGGAGKATGKFFRDKKEIEW